MYPANCTKQSRSTHIFIVEERLNMHSGTNGGNSSSGSVSSWRSTIRMLSKSQKLYMAGITFDITFQPHIRLAERQTAWLMR